MEYDPTNPDKETFFGFQYQIDVPNLNDGGDDQIEWGNVRIQDSKVYVKQAVLNSFSEDKLIPVTEEIGYDIGTDCRVTIQDPAKDTPQPGQEGLWLLDKGQTCVDTHREPTTNEACQSVVQGVCDASATIVFKSPSGLSRTVPDFG